MKEIYNKRGCTIYHGDCTKGKLLRLLAKQKGVLLLTDPPYGINYNRDDVPQGKHTPSHRRQTRTVTGDDIEFDPEHLLIFKRAILWGANCYAHLLPPSPHWLVWDKVTRNGLKLRIAECEFAWTNCVPRPQVFRHLWSGSYRATEQNVRLHPTQKPTALMSWCIKLIKPKPKLIVDPYMGSGSTLWAASQSGIAAVGIEIEEDFCHKAISRLKRPSFGIY